MSKDDGLHSLWGSALNFYNPLLQYITEKEIWPKVITLLLPKTWGFIFKILLIYTSTVSKSKNDTDFLV